MGLVKARLAVPQRSENPQKPNFWSIPSLEVLCPTAANDLQPNEIFVSNSSFRGLWPEPLSQKAAFFYNS
jgi:hypothetical protein